MPKLFTRLSTALEAVKTAVFPTDFACFLCGAEIKYPDEYCLCDKCAYEKNDAEICIHCGRHLDNESAVCESCKDAPLVHFDVARSALVYTGSTVALVRGLKFGSKKYMAPPLGALVRDTFLRLDWKIDIVLPVPLSQKRFKSRGYNQAAELAKPLCEKLIMPMREDILKKARDIPYQARLSRAERLQNIKGAYELADGCGVEGKTLLLVDDVMTTGATAEECGRVLKTGGASKVYVLTLASTLLYSAQTQTDGR